jgi:hypothetical protein
MLRRFNVPKSMLSQSSVTPSLGAYVVVDVCFIRNQEPLTYMRTPRVITCLTDHEPQSLYVRMYQNLVVIVSATVTKCLRCRRRPCGHVSGNAMVTTYTGDLELLTLTSFP